MNHNDGSCAFTRKHNEEDVLFDYSDPLTTYDRRREQVLIRKEEMSSLIDEIS